jgi:hypothetical protein
MTAVKKRRRPANDQHSHATQRMSYVVLPRPYWRGQRIAVVAVLAVFGVILGIVLAANMPILKDKTPVVAAETETRSLKTAEPFDITISASELAPPDDVARLAAQIPVHVLITKPSLRQKALPPVLEVTVEEDSDGADDAADRAVRQAAVAQSFMRQNDVKQALPFQHRAAELAPDNMLYRLDLAIMHDKVADFKGAATLYRQVVQAYDNHDATLPSKLGIDDIRSRLEYLVAMAP